MPPRRTAGRASSAPTTAANAAPATSVTNTGTSKRSTSWAVVNAPMAANAAWASETCPAMPVMTVMERKTTARITAWVTRRSQKALAWLSTHHSPTAAAISAKTRVAIVSSRLRSAAASPGGGGSTPASGSASSGRRRSRGEKIKSRKRAMNGNDGRSP